MLDPEALFPGHSGFFECIQRTRDGTVADGVRVDLNSLLPCRGNDSSEVRVALRLQPVYSRRITIRLRHFRSPRAERAIENQLDASNGEHSVSKVGFRSACEIARYRGVAAR